MKDLKQFNTELKQKNLAGYWETAEANVPPASFQLQAVPVEIEGHSRRITQAGEVVGLEMVSRRVIRLCSPEGDDSTHVPVQYPNASAG